MANDKGQARKESLLRLREEAPYFAQYLEPIYEVAGWEWAMSGRTPTTRMIRAELERMTDDVVADERLVSKESGGIGVRYDHNSDCWTYFFRKEWYEGQEDE